MLIIEFLTFNGVSKGTATLAGNCIHTDRKFLLKHMPSLMQYFSGSIIDVTTFKQLGYRWNKNMMKQRPKKKNQHRACDDILESIEELKFYKLHFLKSKK